MLSIIVLIVIPSRSRVWGALPDDDIPTKFRPRTISGCMVQCSAVVVLYKASAS